MDNQTADVKRNVSWQLKHWANTSSLLFTSFYCARIHTTLAAAVDKATATDLVTDVVHSVDR